MATKNRFAILKDDDNELSQLTKKILATNLEIMKKKAEEKAKARRDWLELPQDVMSLIFIKLGAIDILYRAQSVCSSWRNLSKEPYLFHSIDLRNIAGNRNYCGIDKNKLVKESFDRSCGQLVEFFGDYWFSCRDNLHYFADNSMALKCFRFNFEKFKEEEVPLLIDVVRKAPFLEEIGVSFYYQVPTVLFEAVVQLCPKLRCLRLRCNGYGYYYNPLEGLIKFARNFPFLEELDLSYFKFPAELIKEVGRSCTQLKCLRLNNRTYCSHLDVEAYGIAENILQIRRLHLSSCELTNYGVKWMLNRCTNLEYLNIASCRLYDLEGIEPTTLICKKSGKTIRLPNDDGKRRWNDYGFDEDYQDYLHNLDSLDDLDNSIFLPKKSNTYYL